MHNLIFATNNSNKIFEVRQMLNNQFTLKTLADVGIHEEIPETGDTLEANASQKSNFVYERTKQNCFADDSGLEVEALDGAPGVFSARYSGSRDMKENIRLLLENLKAAPNRRAKFRTVISLILNQNEYLFEGSVSGLITLEPRGKNGFGYDPVFIPDGFERTFAEMTSQEKDSLSHRAEAIKKLTHFLSGTPGSSGNSSEKLSNS